MNKKTNSSSMAVNGARGVVVDFKRAVKQDSKEESYDESKDYPEVLFTSGVRRVITPEEWSIEVAGEQQASRVQCPLALAWALSIHKAQGAQFLLAEPTKGSVFSLSPSVRSAGMSISKVQMKLGNIWEYGQGYVGMKPASYLPWGRKY
jgi:hypothetical protein